MPTRGNPIMVMAGIEKRSNSTVELLERLNIYGQAYQTARGTKDAKLIIFASYVRQSTASVLQRNFEYLEIYPIKSKLWRLPRQIHSLLDVINIEKRQPRMLIAGDPVVGFLIAYIAKLFSFNRHFLQVQFHGDIYEKPKKFGIKTYVRWVLARFQISAATSIRVVSRHQAIEISNLNSSKGRNVVVAPIPISRGFYSARLDKKRDRVGFIGRFHVERGINLLQEIVSGALLSNPELRFHIIGDGSERKSLENNLRKSMELKRVFILGWQNHENLIGELEQMKILLSTASSEGYGLAIREAVLAGVQVIAKNSGGAREAQTDFPDSVYIYKDLEGAIRLISERKEIDLPRSVVIEARNLQIESDLRSTEALVNSWF
jgi:glycosyltransferase involved in cell wall biosynthesis